MRRITKVGVDIYGEPYWVEDGALNLSGTQVSDLTPLVGMPLEELWLYDTQVIDLTPLADTSLRRLYLNGTQVSDLTPLSGMPLKVLDLNGTPAAKKPLPVELQQRVDDGVLTVYGLERS